MAESYISHYANGEAVDAALDSGVAAQSEVTGARGSYGNLNARLSAVETSLSNKANSSSVYTKTQVDDALGGKVDKVTGKGLSTNDYTTVEKTKLAGLQNYDDSALNGRVTTVEQSVATLNGSASTSGSVANSVAAGVSDAKDYTDTEIGKLDVASVGGSGKYIKSVEQSDGKITAVEQTMDTTPTSDSTNAVTSGGVQAAIASETSARQGADDALHDAVGAVAAQGAKNFFDIEATPTVNHTDFTLVSGKLTVTANGNWAHYSVQINLPSGSYILSTVISGYSKASGAPDTSMRLRMSATTSGGTNIVLQTVTGNGAISVPFTWTGGTLYLQFYSDYNATTYANSFAAENTMIRRAEITDDTFAPYAPTNRELYETEQRQALRYEDSGIIRLNQLSWSQTSSGSGMWIADCYTAQSIDTIVSVIIMSFGALKPSEIKTLFTYIPSSVSGMHTVRLVCDQNLASISSNPTLYLRVFGYGYQASSLQSAPASLMQAGRIDAELTDTGTDESEDEER